MVILNPGLSEAKVDKIKESVTKLCGPNAGFCTALQGQIKFLLSSLSSRTSFEARLGLIAIGVKRMNKSKLGRRNAENDNVFSGTERHGASAISF
jgi:hypothetical protein